MTTDTHQPHTLPTHTVRVLANKERIQASEEGNEVRELIFEIDDPDFQCEAGQSLGISAPLPPGSMETFHLRWYSVADAPATDSHGRTTVTIFVRRVTIQHPETGKPVRGLASNYLCNLKQGDTVDVIGPYGIPFPMPEENDATLLLIGVGTGIAPFRSFVKTLYNERPDWQGVIRLFYGTRNGLDMLYANDPDEDVAQYFDQETFEALKAFSPPPHWADPITWDMAYSERGSEMLKLLEKPNTYVYVAGRTAIGQNLDSLFSKLLNSENRWNQWKQDLQSAGRWVEMLY